MAAVEAAGDASVERRGSRGRRGAGRRARPRQTGLAWKRRRLNALRDGDEVVALAAPLLTGELAQARPGCLARDSAESDPLPRAVVVREDGNPVDPLPDLAPVDLDEGGNLDAGVHQHARVQLADRPGAPHDSRPATQDVPAQVVDLAARERRQRVPRIRPCEPG